MNKRYIVFILTFICVSQLFAQEEKYTYIHIATPGISGSYDTAGRSICKLVNKERKQFSFRCHESSTPGSIFNINALVNGETEFAIIQSDLQHQAISGNLDKRSLTHGAKGIRALFSLYDEPFMVIVPKDSNLKRFKDIKGKRVNLGPVSERYGNTFEDLLRALNWKMHDFKSISHFSGMKQIEKLCASEIDAVVMHSTLHNPVLKLATRRCSLRVLPVEGSFLEKVMNEHSFYKKMLIAQDLNVPSSDKILTFGVKATVVTFEDVSDAKAYAVVKSVFENIKYLRKFHPVLADIEETEMLKGNPAPFSGGALRYFEERGWLSLTGSVKKS